MCKLNHKLWPIVKEYTRQVAELFDCAEWHWIGTDDDGEKPVDVCDFDGSMFMSLEEMQIVIDRLDEWVKRYGSRDAVAQEVRDWFDWWLEDSDPDGGDTTRPNPLIEIYENRLQRYQRTYPRINLENWLAGCPRDAGKREMNIDDELRLRVCQRDMLKTLIEEFRESRSMWNIIDNLSAEIKALEAAKKKRDAEDWQRVKQTEAYKDFEKAVKDCE